MDELMSEYSELHKDLYGCRPHCDGWAEQDLVQGIATLREELEAEQSAPASGNGWAYDGDPRALEAF